MLAPDSRAVLLNELRPPTGSRLDIAVATTFTLDLTTALVAPLAFAAHQLGRTVTDPVAAMEAVRSCADRVDVFCQAGQISVPTRETDLMAFLEPIVHEVRSPRPGRLFHPKIWLLRYSDPDRGELSYRLLCLSRNLTDSRSWDVVLRLDGEVPRRADGSVGRQPFAFNRPLYDLLRSLPGMATTALDAARRERILDLAESVRRVDWDLPEDVNELEFHVFGLAGKAPGSANFEGYRHLVVSPFLTDTGLGRVTVPKAQGTEISVVSRVEELDRLDPATVKRIQPYVVAALAGMDESEPDGAMPAPEADPNTLSRTGTGGQILSGLHAKLYVVERGRNAHVFIGSANATDAAFDGNVEFLVELVGGATRLGVSTFLGEDAPFNSMIEPYKTDGGADRDLADEALRALEGLLRDVAMSGFTATVNAAGEGYQLMVTSGPPSLPHGHRLTAELLTRQGEATELPHGQPVAAPFGPMPLHDVTPFVVLRLASRDGLRCGTVVRAALVRDPAGRLDAILARQVDSPEKFLRFLALLLGLAGGDFGTAGVVGSLAGGQPWAPSRNGVFELVVRALAERPDAIADLDRLVTRLQATESGRKALPEGFDALWSAVSRARELLEGS